MNVYLPSGYLDFVKIDRYAEKNNIAFILIAGGRGIGKTFGAVAENENDPDPDENDDVLGSSEITNLAGVVMSYGRSRALEDDQRLIKITKNRLTGRCNFEGFVANYNAPSKRIYGVNDFADAESECFARFEAVQDMEFVPF